MGVLKALRRKSTSAIMPLRLSEVKVGDSDETGDDSGEKKDDDAIVRDADDSKHIKEDESSEKTDESVVDSEDGDAGSNESINNSAYLSQSLPKGRAYLEKVNERKRTWDYFEINHPKAISDKKLEQLKEKYTRRKTEASLLLEKKKEEREVGKSEREGQSEKEGLKNGRKALATTRTMSMPVIETLASSEQQKKKSLELAWDPLTGESLLDQDTESVDSGRESDVRRLSTSSTSEESASSRKSSRRKSSHLADILELA